MRFFLLIALLSHVLAKSGFLVAPLLRTTISTPQIRKPNNHLGFFPRVLQDKIYGYVATFEIGGQRQTAIIDTGSADLWVFDSKSGAITTYNTETAQNLGVPFDLTYVDGIKANGTYYLDDFVWGDINVKLQFGVSEKNQSTVDYSNLGLGNKILEASAYENANNTYDNLPLVLKKQGLIYSASYSIDLGGVDEDEGKIVFGAFDTSRFSGKLKLFNFEPADGFLVHFEVNGRKQIAALDTGTTFCYFDSDLVHEIATGYGAVWDVDARVYAAPELPESDLVFSFCGVAVVVPVSELWKQYKFDKVIPSRYFLTIMPNNQSHGINILGGSFLRSAYVVHDLDHNQVAVGQANHNPGPPNYVTIGTEGISSHYTI